MVRFRSWPPEGAKGQPSEREERRDVRRPAGRKHNKRAAERANRQRGETPARLDSLRSSRRPVSISTAPGGEPIGSRRARELSDQ
ncbi:hypothetical protein EYF80_045945 [Liparis tanakae]|uniref:Uncharacterized protein n=1 Tax=Liparis tanakae TaxID=230148 RepID=A0A4Z2FS74_9TELE|nr:hypothetical protein EYF80_045945 [Liparis tanakae]